MRRFTDLRVWQRAHAAIFQVYRASASFPDDERFGLTAQLRRAALSVSANIAEGTRRVSQQEYSRFLNIAEGSTAEAQALLLVARDLLLLDEGAAESLGSELEEIGKMLYGLRSKVERGGRT